MIHHRWSVGVNHRPAAPAHTLVACGALAFTLAVSTTFGQSESLPGSASDIGVTGPLSADRFYLPDEQLRGLVSTLLEENPQVLMFWARSRSSFERVPQEKSLPDAQFTYRYFAKTPETRVGPQDHWLEFSQGVPWGGKRGLQASRAEALASGTAWEAEDVERRLVAELKRAYFEAAYLQEALAVNSEEQGDSETVRDYRVDAVHDGPGDPAKASSRSRPRSAAWRTGIPSFASSWMRWRGGSPN